MNMKKLSSFLLAAAMVLTLLSGCGAGGAGDSSQPQQPQESPSSQQEQQSSKPAESSAFLRIPAGAKSKCRRISKK